jgi:hypothetical protein
MAEKWNVVKSPITHRSILHSKPKLSLDRTRIYQHKKKVSSMPGAVFKPFHIDLLNSVSQKDTFGTNGYALHTKKTFL